METKEGFVFLYESQDTVGRYLTRIFGPSTNKNPTSLEENNITPYSSLEEAVLAARKFEKRNLKRLNFSLFPHIADFSIRIALDFYEARKAFAEESDLVVIMKGDLIYSLIGPVFPNIPDIANGMGSEISYNGLTLFNSKRGKSAFHYASYAASEISRQAGAETRIAKLRIRIRDDSALLVGGLLKSHQN